MSYSVVVLISGNGSNLQAIIDASLKGAPFTVCAVISDKAEAFGLERARKANIPTQVVSAVPGMARKIYDERLQEVLSAYSPDLIVLAGFMRILSAEFVQNFPGQIINIHPSLLPKFPGLDTHERALAAGETLHGVSVHFVTEVLDGGPLIAQWPLVIESTDDAVSLKKRVHVIEHKIYPAVIQWLAEGRLRLSEQQVYLDDKLLPKQGYQFPLIALV